ncbi:MAG: MFS transporter [Candidatus Omnitrophica bacterium]|nr:MFS transporter [Candidatus Omnitrophota bacterium]
MKIFRAFGYRNFRLFFVGQGISMVGTWMQAVASGWLAYRLTNSPFMLGIVGFSSQAPIFLLGPLGGFFADTGNKRRILIVTQAISMVQAIVLAALTLSGKIEVWHIIVLGVVLGCVNSFDMPVRQSFIVDMVERKEILGNAIALNSLQFNVARLIGPSIAGILIAVWGEGVCFLINGLSFIAVILSLAAMRVALRESKPKNYKVIEGIREGFNYVSKSIPIRHILLLLSVVSVTGASYVVLMPIFARDIIGGGPETLGFLMSSAGIGALGATLYLASRRTVRGLGRMLVISASIFALSLAAFSFSKSLAVSMTVLVITGFGVMAHMAASNIILQTIADDDKRGRMMSFYTMAFIGTAPIGSLLSGIMASRIGASNTLVVCAILCLAASAVFANKLPVIRQAIRPIYKKMGIIPEVASGLNAVNEFSRPPED